MVDALPSFLTREMERESVELRGEPEVGFRFMEGRINFFCLEAGRISSRSTGTPSETRKRRRMRERIQLGGCKGGGATNCDHSDALRGVRNIGFSADTGGKIDLSMVSGGKRESMYDSVAACTSSGESSSAKSRTG